MTELLCQGALLCPGHAWLLQDEYFLITPTVGIFSCIFKLFYYFLHQPATVGMSRVDGIIIQPPVRYPQVRILRYAGLGPAHVDGHAILYIPDHFSIRSYFQSIPGSSESAESDSNSLRCIFLWIFLHIDVGG